jgi:HEAT repeat protein
VWSLAFLKNGLPTGQPAVLGDMSPAARRGAAQVFGVNVADALSELIELFDDDDAEVRRHAASAMGHLDALDYAQVEELVRGFMNSPSFVEHFESLLDALDAVTATLPNVAIEVCERTLDVAGTEIADIRTSAAAAGPQVTSIVLRLYRQAEPGLRSRCLDLIDRLTEAAVYGVAQALEEER